MLGMELFPQVSLNQLCLVRSKPWVLLLEEAGWLVLVGAGGRNASLSTQQATWHRINI